MANYSKADILDQFGGVIRNSLGTTFGPIDDDDKIVFFIIYMMTRLLQFQDTKKQNF